MESLFLAVAFDRARATFKHALSCTSTKRSTLYALTINYHDYNLLVRAARCVGALRAKRGCQYKKTLVWFRRRLQTWQTPRVCWPPRVIAICRRIKLFSAR